MIKLLATMLVLGVVILSFPLERKLVDTLRAGNSISEETQVKSDKSPQIPVMLDPLAVPPPIADTTLTRKVTLEEKNMVVLRGVVQSKSVTDAMRKLSKMSRELPKSAVIYLVLDTPGGSVPDGIDLIQFIRAIPQKVVTITLFAASMGFQIVENNPNERLIVRNGILMSHRAALQGLGGQMDGELETHYRLYKRETDYLDLGAATRLGLSLADYKAKIKNEYWIHGFDAVNEKVADAEILLSCGASLDGTDLVQMDTMFGSVGVEYERCPLLKEPVAIHMDKVPVQYQRYVYNIIHDLIYEQVRFTKEIIVTNKYLQIFR